MATQCEQHITKDIRSGPKKNFHHFEARTTQANGNKKVGCVIDHSASNIRRYIINAAAAENSIPQHSLFLIHITGARRMESTFLYSQLEPHKIT
jgi:hypothetical protein